MAAVSAFILAGGKSSRMGRDKAFLEIDGSTLLARALKTCRSVTPNPFIVGDAAKFAGFAPVIEDEFHDCGPLAGIHAALRHSATELNFMLAVDLPFVTPDFLRFLIAKAESSDMLVTAPVSGGRNQPLCAVYRRDFADLAESALCQGHNRIDRLFTPDVVQTIPEEAWVSLGFPTNMFHNLNTPEDLAAIKLVP